MKILIGTPIHMIKDYCMERWLDNVAKLQKVTPADLLLVDNSPGTDYVEKVKGYCSQYEINDYKIIHLDLSQDKGTHYRIDTSHEFIRRFTISNNYDAWFSWECDQLIPTDTLTSLANIMVEGNYLLVIANSWARENTEVLNTDMGVTLIKKDALVRNSLFRKPSRRALPRERDSWQGADYKRKILNNGGNYVELFGVIKPIFHLNI